MGQAAITLEGGELLVRGSGFGDGGKVQLLVRFTAANGDNRSARHAPAVAHAYDEVIVNGEVFCRTCGTPKDSPTHQYAAGDIDFSEPLTFTDGTIDVTLIDQDGELAAQEVFHLD
jgi:hypothetical protein